MRSNTCCGSRRGDIDSGLYAMMFTRIFCSAICIGAVASESVRFENGKLVYMPNAQGNIIPDFSNCGYGGGGVEPPANISVKETVEAPAGDAGAVIQAALDKVAALPLD